MKLDGGGYMAEVEINDLPSRFVIVYLRCNPHLVCRVWLCKILCYVRVEIDIAVHGLVVLIV